MVPLLHDLKSAIQREGINRGWKKLLVISTNSAIGYRAANAEQGGFFNSFAVWTFLLLAIQFWFVYAQLLVSHVGLPCRLVKRETSEKKTCTCAFMHGRHCFY